MVRYADDFDPVSLRGRRGTRLGNGESSGRPDNGLTLHPTKTKIVDSRTERVLRSWDMNFAATNAGHERKVFRNSKTTLRLKTRRNQREIRWKNIIIAT